MSSAKKQKKPDAKKQKKVVSISETRPTKQELKEATKKTMEKFKVAIDKLSKR